MGETFERTTRDRLALADLLETLTPEQWAHPSLCSRWTVLDVAAHLTVLATTSIPTFVVEMAKARGSFDRANVALTARRARLGPDGVVALLREIAGSRATPPGAGWEAPYADVRVHTLDLTVPLGLDCPLEPGGWPVALDFLVSPTATRGFTRTGRPDVTLVADDVDWRHGGGPEVRGPAASLALALCGRRAGLAGLDGPGLEPLRGWLRA